MIVNFKTQDLSLEEDMSELLCQIDKRLSHLGKIKLNSERYGARDKVDEDSCFILSKYKEILTAKLKGYTCLKRYKLDEIVSVIKQYLASGKVQKFKKSDLDNSDDIQIKVPLVIKYDAQINYNFYNYNSFVTNNNNITETIDDSWTQTSW